MHRIGFNLLPWSATVSEALYPHIERIRDIGYDGIEYSMGAQDAAAYRGLGAFLADLDMACTSCLALEPEHNPASSDAAVRQQGLEKICWAIDRAVDTGAASSADRSIPPSPGLRRRLPRRTRPNGAPKCYDKRANTPSRPVSCWRWRR